jgi:hypothetical protein
MSDEAKPETFSVKLLSTFVVAALLIVVAAVSAGGAYFATSSYDAAHPFMSTVSSVSTVSLTQAAMSYVTRTEVNIQTQTVTGGTYGFGYGYQYVYGYGPSCYGGCYYPQYPARYRVIECNAAYLYGLQTWQSCIAGSVGYQGSCLFLYDSYDGNTYVLLGNAASARPTTTYANVVGYVLSASPYPCVGIPFEVSYYLPT